MVTSRDAPLINGAMTFSPVERASRLAARALLVASSLVVAYYAFYPGPRHPRLLRWDKGEHILAFAVLSVVSFAAFPRLNPYFVLAILLFLGAGIELIQMTHWVRRDGDLGDWLFEAAVVLALTILRVTWRLISERRRLTT